MIVVNNERRVFWGDAFTTLVYGAVVSLLLSLDAQDGDKVCSLLPLVMILFISCDWISRVLLPHQLPTTETSDRLPSKVLYKTVAEVAGLFFLTGAFVSLLNSTSPTKIHHLPEISLTTGFSLFLLMTFSWNLLLLIVMENLNWFRDLTRMCIFGNTLESPNIAYYSRRLLEVCQALKDDANDQFREAEGDPEKIFKSIPRWGIPFSFRGLCRWFFQFFVNHITWASFVCAVLLVFNSEFEGLRNITGIETMRDELTLISGRPFMAILISLVAMLFGLLAAYKQFKVKTVDVEFEILRLKLHRVPALLLLFFATIYWVCYWFWPDAVIVPILLSVLWLVPFCIFFIAEVLFELNIKPVYYFARTTGSLLMIALFVVSYLLLPSKLLILYVAIEQVVVTIFLFHAASANGDTEHTPNLEGEEPDELIDITAEPTEEVVA